MSVSFVVSAVPNPVNPRAMTAATSTPAQATYSMTSAPCWFPTRRRRANLRASSCIMSLAFLREWPRWMDRASHRGPVVQARLRADGRENVVELGADRRTEPRQSDTDDGGDEHAGPGHVLHDLGPLLVSNETVQSDPQRFELHHVS